MKILPLEKYLLLRLQSENHVSNEDDDDNDDEG